MFAFTFHTPYPGDDHELPVDEKLTGTGPFDIQALMKVFKCCESKTEIFVYHKFDNCALMMNIVFGCGYVKAMSHEACDLILGENKKLVEVAAGVLEAFVHPNVYYIESETFAKLLG